MEGGLALGGKKRKMAPKKGEKIGRKMKSDLKKCGCIAVCRG